MTPQSLPPPLLALTPGDLTPARVDEALGWLREAIEAGLTGVLVREPSLPDRALLALAGGLRTSLDTEAGASAWLGVHDRVHLAAAARADAVHLGFRSLVPGAARRVLDQDERTANVAIGLSTHAGDAPESWADADYRIHGPVLDTPSKRGLKTPVGFEELARTVAGSDVPLWAIGGLAPEHAADVARTGAAGMAVLSGIAAAPDRTAAVHAYLAGWPRRAEIR